MTTYEFTATDVAAKVREIAATKPDYVYGLPLCANVDGPPGNMIGGCIVGRALVELGVAPQRFVDLGIRTAGVFKTLRCLGIFDGSTKSDYTEQWSAVSFLLDVQVLQDRRLPWGSAVARADESRRTL